MSHPKRRVDAGFDQASDGGKQITEIMPHPAAGDADDRDAYAGTAQSMQPAMAQPSASLIGGPEFDPEPDVNDHGATREIGVQVAALPTPTHLLCEYR